MQAIIDDPTPYLLGARSGVGFDRGVGPATGARWTRCSFFLDRPRLPAAIVATVGTDAMRRLRLVAVRTFAEAYRTERVMGAALGGSRLLVSSFRIRHR